MDFTPFFPLDELPPGKVRVRDGVAVIRLDSGELYAIDNACPHQGYPLAQGGVVGTTITCAWHNFKFDVRTGNAVMGEEGVGTHPVRVLDGVVHVAIHREVNVERAWAGLADATRRHQGSRVAREVARLLVAGTDPAAILAWAARWDNDRCEYGPGHTTALAADLLGWLDGTLEHDVQVVCEALDLAARSVLGLPPRTRPEPEVPSDGAAGELARRVEAENAPGAEALARGMVAAGWSRAELEAALYPLVAAHFLDFGHPLIYVQKFLDLADRRPEVRDALVGGLVYGIANGTRESSLPGWAGFRARWARWSGAGGADRALSAFAARGGVAAGDSRAWVAAVADGTPAACFEVVAGALEAGRWHEAVDAVVLAASLRVSRFDQRHDADPTLEEGWLWVTHRLTAAHALRGVLERWPTTGAARLVLMVAHFVNGGKALDLAAGEVVEPHDSSSVDTGALLPELRAWVLEDRAQRPIFFAHHVKTLVAAAEELPRVGEAPLRATERFLRAPLQERPVRRFAHEAVRLVRDGKPPRLLSG